MISNLSRKGVMVHMKIAIVDDDLKITDQLSQYIARFGKERNLNHKITIFHTPLEFLNAYTKDYDLVILDIEMPGLNGIETAKELRRMDPSIVLMFVTNLAQYALQGYEVEAIDYIVKPVSYPDFALKLQKAMRYVSRNQDYKVVIATADAMIHMKTSDIYYVEVEKHYLIYHTTQGNYTVRGVMKEVEQELDEYHFIRSNHCYLVNLKYVSAIEGEYVTVANQELKISRNKKKEFMDAFTRYVGGMH